MFVIKIEWDDGESNVLAKFLGRDGEVYKSASEVRGWKNWASALRECLRRGWVEGKVDAIVGTVSVIQIEG